jgi:hypothetical protein
VREFEVAPFRAYVSSPVADMPPIGGVSKVGGISSPSGKSSILRPAHQVAGSFVTPATD